MAGFGSFGRGNMQGGWGSRVAQDVQSLPNSGFYRGVLTGGGRPQTNTGGGMTGQPGWVPTPNSANLAGVSSPVPGTTSPSTPGGAYYDSAQPASSGWGSNSHGTFSADPMANSGGHPMPSTPTYPTGATPMQLGANGQYTAPQINPSGTAMGGAMETNIRNILGSSFLTNPDGTPDYAQMSSPAFFNTLTDEQKMAYEGSHLGNMMSKFTGAQPFINQLNQNSNEVTAYSNAATQAFGGLPRENYHPDVTWAQNWTGDANAFQQLKAAYDAYVAGGGNSGIPSDPTALQYKALTSYWGRNPQAAPAWYAAMSNYGPTPGPQRYIGPDPNAANTRNV